MAESAKPQVPVHPHLAKSGQTPESIVKLSGYVGPASREGQIRLYSSLEDLSHYIEFDEGAVVDTEPAPEAIAPNKGVTLWVKESASIRWICEYKNVRSFWSRVANMALGRGRSEPPGAA